MILNLKKHILITALFTMSGFANAVPNIWTSGVQMGTYGNVISNSQNNSLQINCDVGGGYGNGIYFFKDINDGEWVADISTVKAEAVSEKENKKSDMSLLLNDSIVLTKFDLEMDYRNFFRKIASAKKIEVFNYNKPLGSFSPTEKSRLLNAQKIESECTAYK